MAVKVLPEPVAICIKALGRFCLKDASKLVIAVIWQSRKPSVGNAGKSCKRLRSDLSALSQALKASGLWKLKISLALGFGSVKLVNRVTSPVLI